MKPDIVEQNQKSGSKKGSLAGNLRTCSTRKAERQADPVEENEKEERPGGGESYRLQGLDRVAAILDVLSTTDNPLNLAEICQRMEIRKSTAHRALMALEQTGLIERAPDSRYRLGLKLYDMGNRAVEQIDLRSRAHPYMRKLALRVGEIVHLGVLHKTRIVYIEKVEPVN